MNGVVGNVKEGMKTCAAVDAAAAVSQFSDAGLSSLTSLQISNVKYIC